MNYKYGKLSGGNIEYAPEELRIDGRIIWNPNAESYLSCGWKLVVADQPAEPAGYGKHWEQDGWGENETQVVRKWKTVDDPVLPKVWKVEDIIYGLIEKNALQAVKAIVGDYWELLTMRDTIEEDNEIFAAKYADLRAAVIDSGAISEEDFDWVMSEAEVW